MMIQVAWLWLRHRREAELTRRYGEPAQANGGRIRRVPIVALAAKLLIALWQFASAGVVSKGALLKTA
jgi:transposase